MSHKAEIIAVGSELLLGNVANTDARYVSEKIASAGVDVLYHTAVGDNPQRLRQVTDIARSRCDLLIFIGGLGPTYDDLTKPRCGRPLNFCDFSYYNINTYDDLTKETVCAAFGLELEFHQDVMEEIKAYFKNVFRREMPDCNRRQAFLPKGCAVFHNPVGTAPGCLFTVEGVTVAMLPGVPHECRYLTDHALLPYLQARQEGVILSHTLHVFGLTEPKVQELLDDLMDSVQNPSLAPYAKAAEVQLRITAKAETAEMCETLMAPLLAEVRRRLGEHICGVDMGDPEVCAVKTLKARSLTVSAAESCTGGLIAKRITDVAGASAVFPGGVVSYTNGVKESILGVPGDILAQFGAVSEPVAKAMAEGARRIMKSDLALSVTGLAGPDGDDRGNPVGTVYIGLAAPGGTEVTHLVLKGGRESIRQQAADYALVLLNRHLYNSVQKAKGEDEYGKE